MEWILVQSVFIIFSTVSPTIHALAFGVCRVRQRLEGDKIVLLESCCNNFYKKNGVCVECLIGHFSKGKKCERCYDGQYGKKCAETCRCNRTERCDNVVGCIPVHECPIGHSSKGEQCEKCVNGQYGEKCAELCRCNATERCDHVRGCITVTVDDARFPRDIYVFRGCVFDKFYQKERTKKTNPPLDGNPAEQAAGHDNVVTYMTCVAIGSVLVVICGLLANNREAVCRRNDR